MVLQSFSRFVFNYSWFVCVCGWKIINNYIECENCHDHHGVNLLKSKKKKLLNNTFCRTFGHLLSFPKNPQGPSNGRVNEPV